MDRESVTRRSEEVPTLCTKQNRNGQATKIISPFGYGPPPTNRSVLLMYLQ